jgi:hypothetical protein
MSDKDHRKLTDIERLIDRVYAPNMTDSLQFTVRRQCGFELFNTRPYHNYETWSCGYYAEDVFGNVASAEDLEDCLFRLAQKRLAQKNDELAEALDETH